MDVNLSAYLIGATITVGEWEDASPSTSEYQVMTVGEETTIIVKLDRYYSSDTVPIMQFRRYSTIYKTEDFTKIDDKTYSLTTDFVCDASTYSCTVRIVAEKKLAYLENHLKNCDTNTPDGEYPAGEHEFILTAKDGYEFLIPPVLIVTPNQYETWDYTFEKVDDSTFKLNERFKSGMDFSITGEASQKAIVTDKYGLVTVYRPTKDELRNIAASRWEKIAWDEQTVGHTVFYSPANEYIDTAKYIVSLRKLPLHFESSEKDKVYFGPYDMHIECDVIGNDNVILDFGSVNIVGKYQSAIDYNYTEIQAYLPYIGFYNLPVTDFMDKVVNLKYQINIMNGEALVILSADDNIMLTITCKVGTDIPFQMGGNEYVNTSVEPNANYLLETRPFIYVKSHAPTDAEKAPYRDTKFYACFGDLTGYTRATEIDFTVLSDFITKPEIDEIISLIENGVFL